VPKEQLGRASGMTQSAGALNIWERKPLVYLICLVTLFIFCNGVLAALVGSLVLSFADAQAFGVVYASLGIGALV
jgi:hypothetical protein